MVIKYPRRRNLDALYFKIYRNDRWENVCLSDMTDDEKRMILRRLNTRKELEDAIFHLSSILYTIGKQCDIVGKYYEPVESQNLSTDQFISNMLREVFEKHDTMKERKYITSSFGSKFKRTTAEDIQKELEIKDPLAYKRKKLEENKERRSKLERVQSEKPKRRRYT